MNYKIIVGGVLIFVGLAQFLGLFNDFGNKNSPPTSIGLGALFILVIIIGVYFVRLGRKETKT